MANKADGKTALRGDSIISVTCTAPVNIAVIKYWGKRNEDLILPTNSSLSATLHQDQLRAKTTVAVRKNFSADRIWLNGQEQSIDNPRLQRILKEIRKRAPRDTPEAEDLLEQNVHICSENNFPTAAGLASSAAGYACLVYSLAKLFKVKGDISEIARQGSGSACRSIYGGFVAWDMGSKQDGSDSRARQIAPESHWPDMCILVFVVSGAKKPVGSTAGMQTSVHSSSLLQHRIHDVVPDRMEKMATAILNKDFQTFAEITMKESNQLHAICLDTYPPISYMTDTSREIVRLLHAVNDHYGMNKVAYTYDAGPNTCVYLLEQDVPAVLGLVNHFFPPDTAHDFIQGLPYNIQAPSKDLLESIPLQPKKGGIRHIISTKVGPGPKLLTDPSKSLLGDSGLPKKME